MSESPQDYNVRPSSRPYPPPPMVSVISQLQSRMKALSDPAMTSRRPSQTETDSFVLRYLVMGLTMAHRITDDDRRRESLREILEDARMYARYDGWDHPTTTDTIRRCAVRLGELFPENE